MWVKDQVYGRKAKAMMNIERSFRFNLRVYAVLVLTSSVFHAVWNFLFPTYNEMQGLTEIQWGTVLLFNWAIVFLLLLLGLLALTVSMSGSTTLPQLRMFSAFSAGFWLCRLVLEFLLPVRIPFIFIPDPSLLVKGLLIVLALILVLPEIRLRLSNRPESGVTITSR